MNPLRCIVAKLDAAASSRIDPLLKPDSTWILLVSVPGLPPRAYGPFRTSEKATVFGNSVDWLSHVEKEPVEVLNIPNLGEYP